MIHRRDGIKRKQTVKCKFKPKMPIIILNVNGLNTSFKKQYQK